MQASLTASQEKSKWVLLPSPRVQWRNGALQRVLSGVGNTVSGVRFQVLDASLRFSCTPSVWVGELCGSMSYGIRMKSCPRVQAWWTYLVSSFQKIDLRKLLHTEHIFGLNSTLPIQGCTSFSLSLSLSVCLRGRLIFKELMKILM